MLRQDKLKRVTTMKRIAAALPILLAIATMAQDLPRAMLAGRSVEMRIVTPEDLSPIAWPKGNAELTQTATSLEGTNVLLKLKANGIAPDSEALTLVYDLNPSVHDLNSLPANTRISLPSVKSASQSNELSAMMVSRRVHPSLKIRRTELPGRRPNMLLKPQVEKVTTDAVVIKQAEQTIVWFNEVERRFKRRTNPPLRRATLNQLNEEAYQLQSLLQGAIRQNRQATDGEEGTNHCDIYHYPDGDNAR